MFCSKARIFAGMMFFKITHKGAAKKAAAFFAASTNSGARKIWGSGDLIFFKAKDELFISAFFVLISSESVTRAGTFFFFNSTKIIAPLGRGPELKYEISF